MLAKIRQVMLLFAAADNCVLLRDDYNIAFSVWVQLQLFCGLPSRQSEIDFREAAAVLNHAVDILFATGIDSYE